MTHDSPRSDREIVEEGFAYAERAKVANFQREAYTRDRLWLDPTESADLDALTPGQVAALRRYVEQSVAKHKAETAARNVKPTGKDAMNQ